MRGSAGSAGLAVWEAGTEEGGRAGAEKEREGSDREERKEGKQKEGIDW